jgi:hypothetical protein
MTSRIQLRPLVAAALGGMLASVVVATLLSIPQVGGLWASLRYPLGYAAPALLLLLVLAAVQFTPYAWRELKHWASTPFRPLDAFLVAALGALVSAPRWVMLAWGHPTNDHRLIAGLAWLVGTSQVLRWTMAIVKRWHRPQPPPDTIEGALLDKVVGSAGLEPLLDIGPADALDHQSFVQTLEAVVRHPREHPFTFGLNGPWGSGKTTVLNALERRLRAHGAIVARFDAWSFREPERIVSNYLAQLGRALRQAGGPSGLTAQLRAIGIGIAPLAGSRIADVARNWLSSTNADSVRETLEELRIRLRAQGRIVVIVVDDLDRLERDELHAALRTLRLLADLPGIVHVLAYDRRQVERILFPEDLTGKVARDYIAKIVHVELSLSTPTSEATSRVLSEALQPLLDIAGTDGVARFSERLNSLPRKVFVEAMPTPRDVRRVAAATAVVWPRLQREVNLFDLFILQLIHARFARVFGMIHLHPEWFTEQEWSPDLWRISEGKRWKKERDDYVGKLMGSEDPDDVNAARLLALIFPSAQSVPGRRHVSESEARRDRRICHPNAFPRYFQLSVPRETVAESSIEDLAAEIRAAPPEVRAALAERTITEAARTGRLMALLDQWDLFIERLGPAHTPLPYDLVRDVCIGLARAASALPSDYNDPLDPRRTAWFRILKLADRSGTNADVSKLLAELIRECPSFAISGLIVFYTTTPDRDRRVLPDRVLDERRLHGEFDQQVHSRLHAQPSPVFSLADDDIAAVLYRTEEASIVQGIFFSGLSDRPQDLPRLLAFAVKLQVNPGSPDDVSVFHQDLAGLHQRLPLDQLFRVTERLPLEFWEDPQSRALVRYFRENYQRVIAEAART